MMNLPKWEIPAGLSGIAAEDGIWEDENERWKPLNLVVFGDLEGKPDGYLQWQLDLDPFDNFFEAINRKLEADGIEIDGDGWEKIIFAYLSKTIPTLAEKLHFDCENATCGIWVESEMDCKELFERTWEFIHLLKVKYDPTLFAIPE